MRAAEKACAKYQDAIEPPELSDEEEAEFKPAALANARCMREHGVEFPDPTFDENGGAQIRMSKSMGIDPEDPAFQKAMKACEGTMPMGGKTDSERGRVMKRALGGAAAAARRRGWRAGGARRRRSARPRRRLLPRPARPRRWSEPTSSTARTSRARSATRTRARWRRASPAR